MNQPQTKTCVKCGHEKQITEFPFTSSAHIKRRPSCRKCELAARKTRKNHGIRVGKAKLRYQEKQRKQSAERRRDPSFRANWIHEDSRKFDKKRGLQHDLSIEQIRTLISQGCTYCGEQDIRMTLDRIDNTKGHTTDNVVPACYRCNLVRRDMPYEAWMNIVPAMRETRESGLFGDWTGGIHREIGGEWKHRTSDLAVTTDFESI